MTDFAAPVFARGRDAAPGARTFVLVSLAYIGVYFAINAVTDHHSLNGSTITLWSPDNALSVMLIMESGLIRRSCGSPRSGSPLR